MSLESHNKLCKVSESIQNSLSCKTQDMIEVAGLLSDNYKNDILILLMSHMMTEININPEITFSSFTVRWNDNTVIVSYCLDLHDSIMTDGVELTL